jgi:hypothetical protein
MIPRERLINKLREIKYRYQDQTTRVQLYRKIGGTHFVTIPKKADPISDSTVISILKQCGVSDEETEKFIAQNQCS